MRTLSGDESVRDLESKEEDEEESTAGMESDKSNKMATEITMDEKEKDLTI